MKVETKGHSVSVVSINGALELQLVDVDYGYTARVTVTTNADELAELAALERIYISPSLSRAGFDDLQEARNENGRPPRR